MKIITNNAPSEIITVNPPLTPLELDILIFEITDHEFNYDDSTDTWHTTPEGLTALYIAIVKDEKTFKDFYNRAQLLETVIRNDQIMIITKFHILRNQLEYTYDQDEPYIAELQLESKYNKQFKQRIHLDIIHPAESLLQLIESRFELVYQDLVIDEEAIEELFLN